MESTSNKSLNNEQIALEIAKKRVKDLKGFYSHLMVYILVNVFLIALKFSNLETSETFFCFQTFSTALFWGIGLLAHALSVFVKDFWFGRDWETKKIAKIMQQKSNKWE